MGQFGVYFECYKKIRLVKVANSTFSSELNSHQYLWKFLKEQKFEGDELCIQGKHILK